MIWAIIGGMTLILFFNRYLFLEPRLPIRLNRGVKEFLGFAVPGTLTAICGPIIFVKDHQLDLSLANPYLLAGLCAIGLMLWRRNVLLSVVLSVALFYVFRGWL
ncbi:branched-chain amino acid ABC transporter [Pseudomonas fragi]|uniref:AzlD domain-containing protein n=1 Tax=Pseudomonas fragi TaxID=296 RepID=UPI000A2A246C|nr:AzlD domain-containing protein [Pseudomonas fragi]ARQ74266.1 branched-chain amino acid ABC transporter [Pseudomonas fragi]